ncbi:MAG: hypothetical protein K8R74_01270 [Bacteroidales bacterium]|nr:hypothetical protein [Bacteroidales bacterium]
MRNRNVMYPLIVLGLVLVLTLSCEKKDDNEKVPVLTTNEVSDITQTTATCGGNTTDDGGSSVTISGVCWSTDQNPAITDSKTTDGTGMGSFTSAITGLSPEATYYVRAYATNSSGTGYGSAMSFTTLEETIGCTDIDGNVYNTVIVGTQVWMAENLKVTHYRNGNAIPNVTDETAWSELQTGACCDYENSPDNSATYGKLYNYYAVNDSRNIAPAGWHIPTDAEWTILTDYLGGRTVAGGKLKETGTTHWISPNTGASNETGFTGLPGGMRVGSTPSSTYAFMGIYGYWWSLEPIVSSYGMMAYDNDNFDWYPRLEWNGISVRCLKD